MTTTATEKRFLLDTELSILSPEHVDHMLSVNTTLVRGGVYRVAVWCAQCKRYLTASEAIASTVIEVDETDAQPLD